MEGRSELQKQNKNPKRKLRGQAAREAAFAGNPLCGGNERAALFPPSSSLAPARHPGAGGPKDGEMGGNSGRICSAQAQRALLATWEAELAAGDYKSVKSWGFGSAGAERGRSKPGLLRHRSRAAGARQSWPRAPGIIPGKVARRYHRCLLLPGFRALLKFKLAKGPQGSRVHV